MKMLQCASVFVTKHRCCHALLPQGDRNSNFFTLQIEENFMLDQIIGLIAAALTTLGIINQAVKVFYTGQTSGLSLSMYALTTLGVMLWLVYGVRKRDIPLIVANIVTLAASAYILFSILQFW
jgi:MtN3 and saliva related transmembrane protein